MVAGEEDEGESSEDDPEVLIQKLQKAGIDTPDAKKFEEAKKKARERRLEE